MVDVILTLLNTVLLVTLVVLVFLCASDAGNAAVVLGLCVSAFLGPLAFCI